MSAPDRDDPSQMRHDYMTPCSPGDPAAEEKTWMDIEPSQLMEPDVSMKDMLNSLQSSKPSVNKEDVEKMDAFTRDFGQEG